MPTKEPTVRETAVAKRRTPDFSDQLIEPFSQLKTEVDRLFEAFPFRMPTLSFSRFASWPALDMTETDKKYRITAELPGIDADKVEVTFENGMIRIAGHKEDQKEEDERGYRFSERSYGSFERLIELPPAANPQGMHAKFRNGLLTIVVPKKDVTPENVRKIDIQKDS
jgi:HSP20 family protein